MKKRLRNGIISPLDWWYRFLIILPPVQEKSGCRGKQLSFVMLYLENRAGYDAIVVYNEEWGSPCNGKSRSSANDESPAQLAFAREPEGDE